MSTRKFLYVDPTTGLYFESTGAYETSDFVSASSGVANAGAPVKLDATGKIDPSLYGTNIPAADVAVANANGYFVNNNVEAVLGELFQDIKNNGNAFTVGTGGVNKADLLYISSSNTVNTYSTLTTAQRPVGVAATTTAAAGTVVALVSGDKLAGVLTGATPGAPVYWSGTALTTTLPTTTLQFVTEVGVAVNATDLLIAIRLIKRNT